MNCGAQVTQILPPTTVGSRVGIQLVAFRLSYLRHVCYRIGTWSRGRSQPAPATSPAQPAGILPRGYGSIHELQTFDEQSCNRRPLPRAMAERREPPFLPREAVLCAAPIARGSRPREDRTARRPFPGA